MRKILFLGLLTVVGVVAVKAAPAVSKLKNAIDNLIARTGFDRIHGILDTSNKLFDPVLRLFFRVELKNFTGFDLEVKNVFVRLEYMDTSQPEGKRVWTLVGNSPERFNIKIKDGQTWFKSVPIDAQGWFTIASLSKGTNRHRAVLVFEWQGTQITQEYELALAPAISSYVQKFKKKVGLSGAMGEPEGRQLIKYLVA